MSSGKIHSFTTVILAAGCGLSAYQAGYRCPELPALIGGTLAGLLLTPDLDVNRGSISNHHARRLGGCFFGLAWSLIWKPYSLLIPHRSPLSHFPLIGTALRLGYLAALVWLVLAGLALVGVVARVPELPYWWHWAFLGLALSDLFHYILDRSFRN